THKIIRSRRRTISLQIDREGMLIVRAPHRADEAIIHDFIEKKREWIQKHQAIAKEQKAQAAQVSLSEGKEYYRKKAFLTLKPLVEQYAFKIGVEVKNVKITSGRRVWGSCSGQGNLNFNWRLILTPPQIIDYVVIHELAHILERNHSRRFWAKVQLFYPQYKLARKWLRQNAHLLVV
ncbi:MAG: SprT family zinc-dependent metalloprotease, partial [bacterium]